MPATAPAKSMACMIFLGILLLLPLAAHATLWPVGPEGTEMFPHIQAVIDSASLGDTLELADGVYAGPGNVGVIVNKGLYIRSASGNPAACILDGGHDTQIMRFQEISTSQSTLEGVGLRNGWDPRWGGAIVIYLSGSPIIRNCIIADSEAQRGGGIAAVGNGRPRIENTWILNNRAEQGGGLFVNSATDMVIVDTVIGGNVAEHLGGGGLWVGVYAQVVLTRCTLALNCAVRYGGGLFVHAFSNVTFEESILRRNCAGEGGADAYLWDQTVGVEFICSNSDPDLIDYNELAPPTYDFANDSRDPLVCGSPGYRCGDAVTSDDFYLASNSPCLPSTSSCGVRVGALGEQCGEQTLIRIESWSSLKSKF